MRGILLSHGVAFVERNGLTVRILGGKCEISPIMLPVLEWDLRTASPDTWDYMTEGDIRGLGDEVYAEIVKLTEEKA